ncbi:hypothetical protein CHS0354_006332, partial [Potamilus streckersoni]
DKISRSVQPVDWCKQTCNSSRSGQSYRIMEKSLMILHSLLVLLVVIQKTFACNCKPMTLGQAMCNSTTVILARVKEEETIGAGNNSVAIVKYEIEVQRTFQAEPTNLTQNVEIGYMTFPETDHDCGGRLHSGFDYIIAGNVDDNGVLVSSMCKHINEYEKIVHDTHYTNMLQGDVDCNNV